MMSHYLLNKQFKSFSAIIHKSTELNRGKYSHRHMPYIIINYTEYLDTYFSMVTFIILIFQSPLEVMKWSY